VYIILLGAPGAGKGTQAVMLAEKLNLVQVASGDLFRQALQQKTELGLKAKSYMDKGQLVPDEITIQRGPFLMASPEIQARRRHWIRRWRSSLKLSIRWYMSWYPKRSS
jgi:adenylate kinase